MGYKGYHLVHLMKLWAEEEVQESFAAGEGFYNKDILRVHAKLNKKYGNYQDAPDGEYKKLLNESRSWFHIDVEEGVSKNRLAYIKRKFREYFSFVNEIPDFKDHILDVHVGKTLISQVPTV
jgi:hypothetical protein